MINAVIKGTGSYLPPTILTNFDLETRLDTTHEWIMSRTGIKERRIASSEETTSTMALEAAKLALKNARMAAEEIDLILVATCTPDAFFPSVACRLQQHLNIKKPVPAFDISAACSGFIYAMDIAEKYIKSGASNNILVVGSEVMSRALDWQDRSTCVLFGDGAGAVILGASDKEEGILASVLHAVGDSQNKLFFPNSSIQAVKDNYYKYITMKGNEVFKLAVNIMGEIVQEVLDKAGISKESIDWFIPHQANIRIIQAIANKFKLSQEKVVTTVEQHGNTSAASIPLALDLSVREGKIRRGDLILIESFGGGMTWGAQVIRY